MKKATVINALNELPQEFNFDVFLERLLIIQKIDDGLAEAKAGKTISHDKLKKIVAKWRK